MHVFKEDKYFTISSPFFYFDSYNRGGRIWILDISIGNTWHYPDSKWMFKLSFEIWQSVGFVQIDLKKNYDHINWDFLIYLLQRCGFGGKKRKRIAFCISTFKFLILMNGVPSVFSIAMVAYVKEIPFPIIVCGGC